jgi:RNA polymerase sigma factor (sigma-70 family)
MATAQMDTVLRHLRWTVLRQNGAGCTDGQLLASFIDHKDEAAFEALVHRHGPMVFAVCRRVVGNHHDAEDAFQGTFLVLARKASSVRPRDRLANWLHGVALRTAMQARAMTARRRGREKQVAEMPEPEAAQQDQWRDLQPLLDQELTGLPENYRLPILICDLEGKTIKEAAQQLGWPQGTLAGRLARGRKLLAKRLASRGVLLSAGALAVVSENVASAGIPTSLMSSTVKAATIIAVGQAMVAGAVPAKVLALTEGVMKHMMLAKLRKAAVVGLVALCLCGLGAGGYQASFAQETKTTTTTTTTTTTVTAKATKHGIEELQGKWTNHGDTLTIEGNNWSWVSTFYGNFFGSLKLVATQGDVLHVDLLLSEGAMKGHTCQVIFRRAGNILHYCQSFCVNEGYGPRPTDFSSGGLAISWQQCKDAPR